MRFSADDPFDVPRRYADFALICGGHSPKADNVIYGRLGGRRVRAFDFRYEVGHGTRRMTRHYAVVVVEVERDLPRVLMWNDDDAESSPLPTRSADGHIACWSYRGDPEAAVALKNALGDLMSEGASVQTCGTGLMLFAPVRRREGRRRLMEAVRATDTVDPPDRDHSERISSEQDVENRPPK